MPRRQSSPNRNAAAIQLSEKAMRRSKLSSLLSRIGAGRLVIRPNYGMEELENRTLLMAVTSIGAAGSFQFFTGQGQVGQVTYSDVNFEVIAAFFNAASGVATLGDPVPATTPEPPRGGNIYKIYVTESNADSYITIETLGDLKKMAPEPFAGAIPALGVTNAQTGAPYAAAIPAGTGGILIGAVDPTTKPIANTPITSIPLTVAPFGGETVGQVVTPGIEVLQTSPETGTQNNFGEFFVGGTVTGTVEFGGNINEFYAGAVLTGDINGDSSVPNAALDNETVSLGTSVRSDPQNFFVGGDLREFVTTGPVGTNGARTKVADASTYAYNTSFDLDVAGKIGEVDIGGSLAGTIEAGNSPLISTQTAYPAGTTNPVIGDFGDQNEVESVPPPQPPGIDLNFIGGGFDPSTAAAIPPELDAPQFSNDTLAGAQILGSIPELDSNTGLPAKDVDGNIVYMASVNGVLDNVPPATDRSDTYAVPLLGGVTVYTDLTIAGITNTNPTAGATTQTEVLAEEARLEVYDPDGRIIASDTRSPGSALKITTDRPGLYRFQVVVISSGGVQLQTALDYNLSIFNIGNMGIGAIHVAGDYNDIGEDSGIICGNGDLGAVQVDGTYVSTTDGPTPTVPAGDQAALPPVFASTSVLVASGNLREITAASIGVGLSAGAADGTAGDTGLEYKDPTYLSVPNGSVGLIQATGVLGTDLLAIETQFDPNALATGVYKTDDLYAHAIGGFIEEINADSTLYAQIGTDAGIGTIHASNMDTDQPSHFDVNADNTGDDGIIDLVDVPGQFGVLGAGPEFVTNDGGNIRYMVLGGLIFLPTAFGGLIDAPVTTAAGATATFTDDSGAVFSVTPDGPLTTVTTNLSSGATTTTTTGPQITALTYPVLDKGGLVPVSITSSGSMTISGAGVSGAGSSVDVGSLSITGIGRPITTLTTNSSTGVVTTPVDAEGNTSIQQVVPTGDPTGIVQGPLADDTDEFLSITGPAKFNVLSVTATSTVAGNSPVAIDNATQGEVVTVIVPDGIGTLITGGNLGFATPVATPAAVMPRSDIADGNTYPFVQQHTGVVIGTGFVISDGTPTSAGTTGNAVTIQVGGAAGNIEAGGTIQSLIANAGQSMGIKGATSIAGQYDGIVGPVLATRLLYVDVGQGLLPTGTGSVGLAGIYGTGKVGTVTNAGNNDGDIRGNIVSAEDDSTGIGIDAITVGNASIIGSTIATIDDAPGQVPQFMETSDLFRSTVTVKVNATNFAPGLAPYGYDVGPITVGGLGGIIGSVVETGSVASITVAGGGFGILETYVVGQNTGRLGSISASGYGIRDDEFRGFGYIGAVTATGNGGLVPVTAYPLDVRPSDIPNTVDPFFGFYPDSEIDLNAALGTTAAAPNVANVTDTGVIQDSIFNGENNLTSIYAQKARTALPVFNTGVSEPTPPTANVPVIGSTFDNSITFGGAVGNIHIIQATDGFQITAGSLGGLSLSSSVNRVGISIAGAVSALVVKGNFGQFITDPGTGQLVPDSYLDAGGPNGTIRSLKVLGNLNANVYATGMIGTVTVAGDVLGSITAFGRNNGLALSSLRVFGGIRDGSLTLDGSVGSIIVNGTLGTSAGSLSIAGNANLIEVGAGRTDKNSDLALSLFVAGTLKTLKVIGQITGTVHTGIDLTHLSVTGTGVTPNIITGNMNVDGRLGTATIIDGNVDSQVIVTGSVSSFVIKNGSLLEGATLQSQVGSIVNFKTTGGSAAGVYGSLIALNGTNETIDIAGNVGDGVNPATISADSGKTFRVRGTINDHATISLVAYLNLLRVDGSVLTGAIVSARPLKTQRIAGVNDGNITVV